MEKFEPKKIVCDTCQGSHPTEQHESSVAWTETKEKIISEAEAKKREEEKEENRRRKAKKESGTCSECGGAHSTRQHSTYEGGFFG